ncbi:serine/threonine protein phosphatase 2B catalytic subunit gamma isoform [Entamoeba marina]
MCSPISTPPILSPSLFHSLITPTSLPNFPVTSAIFEEKDFIINQFIDIKKLHQHLLQQGRFTIQAIQRIIDMAQTIFKQETNIISLKAPVVLFGDIHGQFYDLTSMLSKITVRLNNGTKYLFLGDYVDRGAYGLEVLLLLLSLKINFPNQIYLLRGNHETEYVSTKYSFLHECSVKYNKQLYYSFLPLFQSLPICALITTSHKRYFCMHGGLSPNALTLDSISKIDRFMEPPKRSALEDLLWSDPVDDSFLTGIHDEDERDEYYSIEFEINPERPFGYLYGYGALSEFLETNQLNCIIRAHEVQDGAHFYLYGISKVDPLLITLFSAPNYCDIVGNHGGCLIIEDKLLELKKYKNVEHPFCLPDSQNGLLFGIDLMSQYLKEFHPLFHFD